MVSASTTVIAAISRRDLNDLETPALATITGVEHLSSYNWIKAPKDTPTIAVPGSPNLWDPPNRSFQLNQDVGHVFINQNDARHPTSPLEPIFRALYISQSSFDISSVDIVTDRNNIRKLLEFVTSSKKDFSIHVEIKNNTALFGRQDCQTETWISKHQFCGYGHSYEKMCTSAQVRHSTGHHRIISYSFGGLKFLVRHETDGYIDDERIQQSSKPSDNKTPEPDNKTPGPDHKTSGPDILSSVMDRLSLSPELSRSGKPKPATPKLTIRKEGQVVPLSSTLEIKTRVAHKHFPFKEVAPQLWVSQTPKLVIARYDYGQFGLPEVRDVVARIKEWEDQNQKDLRMLAGLIGKIRAIAKENGGRVQVKYDAIREHLYFRKLGAGKMLPRDLYKKWEDKDKEEQLVGLGVTGD